MYKAQIGYPFPPPSFARRNAASISRALGHFGTRGARDHPGTRLLPGLLTNPAPPGLSHNNIWQHMAFLLSLRTTSIARGHPQICCSFRSSRPALLLQKGASQLILGPLTRGRTAQEMRGSSLYTTASFRLFFRPLAHTCH